MIITLGERGNLRSRLRGRLPAVAAHAVLDTMEVFDLGRPGSGIPCVTIIYWLSRTPKAATLILLGTALAPTLTLSDALGLTASGRLFSCYLFPVHGPSLPISGVSFRRCAPSQP